MEQYLRSALLESAQWVWPASLTEPVNKYLEFRHSFEYAGHPDCDAKLLLAADTAYAIFINNQFVDTGRFPDVPPARQYDTLEMGHYLHKGRNQIVIGLHYQGVRTQQYLPGDPGLIYAVEGQGLAVKSGCDTEWRLNWHYCCGDMPLITSQLGFSFEYDAAKTIGTWKRISQADILQPGADILLTPRTIFKSDIEPRLDVKVINQGLLGPTTDDQPSKAMQNDPMSARIFSEFFGEHATPHLPSESGLAVRRQADAVEDFYIIIDLAREEGGLASFDFETDEGVIVDIGYGEHLQDLRVRTKIGGRNFASRYICRQGRQTFTHWYKRMAGRYIQLNVRGVKSGFKLYYAGLLPVIYPLKEQGVFSASDRRMDDIYTTAVRTLRLCMHEHYEDSPWREQALYANDSRNQALAGYYAFGEGQFPAAALELLGKGIKEDDWLELCMPASLRITIPSFTLVWVLAVSDHWCYRGESAFIRRMMPIVERILSARESELQQGLLPCPAGSRYWQFYDWADGLSGSIYLKSGEIRYDAHLNMAYCMALTAGAGLAEVCGQGDLAKHWCQMAEKLCGEIHARFWDTSASAYQTYIGDHANRHFCELVQALAILSGTVRDQKAAAALRTKLSVKSDWVETTLSQSLYKYEALLSGNSQDQRRAIDAVNNEWYAMLRKGATSFWETRLGEADFGGAGSLCHGWSAIPAYLYGAYVLGVRPLAPGFTAFSVNPVDSNLDSSSGKIETPQGVIEVKWRRTECGFSGTVKHPSACRCVLADNFERVTC